MRLSAFFQSLSILVCVLMCGSADAQSTWTTQGNSGCSDNFGSFDAFIPGMRGKGTCNRGGFVPNTTVIVVTNTNSSGSGSLASAMDASCPKVILFGVSGKISMPSATQSNTNDCSNWSVVGTSSPGNVVLSGSTGDPQLLGQGSNYTIDGLVVAPGDTLITAGATDNRDAFDFDYDSTSDNILLFNNAFLWGTDETLSCYTTVVQSNITYWQNIFGAGLIPGHNFNLLFGSNCHDQDLIRNLFIHSEGRNPEGRGDDLLIANNIIHNSGFHTMYFTPCLTSGPGTSLTSNETNIIGNIDVRGPDSTSHQMIIWSSVSCASQSAYTSNNVVEQGSTGAITNCGTSGCRSGSPNWSNSILSNAYPTGYVPETIQTDGPGVQSMGEQLLAYVGPRPTDRLAYITTLVGEAQNGLDQSGSMGSQPTSSASEGGVSVITPASSSYDPTDGNDNPCGEDMPTGAAANAIQSSGLTRLHEWVIGCFYDHVMPAGYRDDGLQNYPAPGGGNPPPPPPPDEPTPNPPNPLIAT